MIELLFLAFFIRTVRNVFYQVFLWQIKEYRFDRMMAHLRTWQGKRMVFGLVSLTKFALIGGYLLGWPVFWLVLILYIAEAIWNLRELKVLGWKNPIWTIKATFITSIIILGSLGGFWPAFVETSAGKGDWGFWVLILDKLLTPAVTTLILIFSLPTKLQREMVMQQAKTIIFKHPNLITIGITGSYGKTSTKEFLANILSAKFKVLKTEGSQNTEIGVAKTVVEKLSDQQIFVCEMAAYKKGEIKDICGIVKPKIGIITAINAQHLELFGSLENTMNAKFELIEALPRGGLAIFNGNNQYTRQLAQRAGKMPLITVVYQYTDPQHSEKANFVASGIKVLPNRLEFEIQAEEEKIKTYAPLLGTQNIENIMAAVVVASRLGMSLKDIALTITHLQTPEMTMKPSKGPQGCTLIDDTFNANPDGVSAVISCLKIFRGKKILIFQPMIELGEATSRLHQEVGEEAAKVCDLIFLTNHNFYEAILQGAALVKGGVDKVFILSTEEIIAKIKNDLTKDDVVAFEGKESKRILEEIKG